MKYPVLHDGEWEYPVHRGYRMMCCDCSLVHRMNFKIEKGQIKLQVFRDNRATAQARRKKKK